jgi:hypothetical protein
MEHRESDKKKADNEYPAFFNIDLEIESSTYNDDNGNADTHSDRNSQVSARTPEGILLQNGKSSCS